MYCVKLEYEVHQKSDYIQGKNMVYYNSGFNWITRDEIVHKGRALVFSASCTSRMKCFFSSGFNTDQCQIRECYVSF